MAKRKMLLILGKTKHINFFCSIKLLIMFSLRISGNFVNSTRVEPKKWF
jgi:hypothetical protein